MQWAIVIAAALSVLTLSDGNAAEWCGYASHAKSLIECGYSSIADCESAVGKGGTCFVDPDYAANEKQSTPSWPGLSRPSPTLAALKN
ncbi:MAG: DUF3551 domain-containing protein [Xanthobacteraceae bacterium]